MSCFGSQTNFDHKWKNSPWSGSPQEAIRIWAAGPSIVRCVCMGAVPSNHPVGVRDRAGEGGCALVNTSFEPLRACG